MPVYCFVCPKCGAKVEAIRPMRESDKIEICGHCNDAMKRDLQAERLGSTNMDFNQPILSEAMGVAPSQVAEHRRLHPDIPLTNDGRVILTSHGERKRIMRKLGFFDKDGYS